MVSQGSKKHACNDFPLIKNAFTKTVAPISETDITFFLCNFIPQE